MLINANWRRFTILALIGVAWLSGACPASGQEYQIGSGPEYTSMGSFDLGEAGAAQPEAAPLPPKKPTPAADAAPPAADAKPPAQPPRRPPRRPARRSDTSRMLASRGPITRLASIPNMFGDNPGGQLQVGPFGSWGGSMEFFEGHHGIVDIPSPAGARNVKISENDKALPMDRIFFNYNHFQNALDGAVAGGRTKSFPIDQYTIGVEKTFFDELWSVELRLPFSRTPQVTGTDLAVDTGDVGNLAVIVKRLLFATETTAVGVGLPIGTPTGSDVTGQALVSSFSLSNDAVHLAPFIGIVNAPNDRVFCEGFLQVDVATQGNRIIYGGNNIGRLDEQTLLYLDFSMGYWLYRNPYAPFLTGLAGVVEYHYTTTLQNADLVGGTDGNQFLQFGNAYNRQDISNITIGLHTELNQTTIRVGAAVPLGGVSNRLFDAEFQISANRFF